MKKEYITPYIGISEFECGDIITTSGLGEVEKEIKSGNGLKVDNQSGSDINLFSFNWVG